MALALRKKAGILSIKQEIRDVIGKYYRNRYVKFNISRHCSGLANADQSLFALVFSGTGAVTAAVEGNFTVAPSDVI